LSNEASEIAEQVSLGVLQHPTKFQMKLFLKKIHWWMIWQICKWAHF